jgi:hypothetical protein
MTPEIYAQGLGDLVTVIPKNTKPTETRRFKKKDGDGGFDYNKLNVNAISGEIWATLPGMTEELVAEILTFRAEQDFRSLREVQDIVGVDVFRGIAKYLTTETTPYYKITSIGKIRGSLISEGVTAVVQFNSPIRKKYQIMEWTDGVSDEKHRPEPVS